MCQETIRPDVMVMYFLPGPWPVGTLCIAIRCVVLAARPGTRCRLKESCLPYNRYIIIPKAIGKRKKQIVREAALGG